MRAVQAFCLAATGLASLLCAGCAATGSSATARFAAVEITGNTPGQIGSVAVQVFHDHGYDAIQTELSSLVFEKRAKGISNLTYGNWADDTPLFTRVKVEILPAGERTYRLQCQAFMVRDRGSPVEEEIKLSRLRSHAFQQLLEEIANRLKPSSAGP